MLERPDLFVRSLSHGNEAFVCFVHPMFLPGEMVGI